VKLFFIPAGKDIALGTTATQDVLTFGKAVSRRFEFLTKSHKT